MNPIPVFSNNYNITSSDVDFKSQLKLSRMFDFFQDIASQHAANLGASVDGLHDNFNVAWVLTKVRVEIDRFPILNDLVTIETWPQEARAIYERDYVIKDADGNVIVRAVSNWVVMNLEKREMLRKKMVDYLDIDILKDRALTVKMRKLKPLNELVEMYKKVIRYSDIDYNEHINNAKYVDYILDCFPVPEIKANEIRAIEVHYLNEALSGDTITLRKADFSEDKKTVYIDATADDDCRVVFNSTLEFK